MTTSLSPAGPIPTPPKIPRPTPAPLTRSPAVHRLTAALARATDDAARAELVRRFWATASRTPLLEASDRPGHHVVTFLWRDPAGPPPVEVYLFVNRLTDERNMARSRMHLVPGTDVRQLSYLMPDDWRAGYCFCPVADAEALTGADQPTLRRRLDGGVPDPFNADRCTGRGGRPMSVVALPDAPSQQWLAARPGVPLGTVRSVEVPAVPGFAGRTVWVYEPAGGPPDPAPVLLLDGDVWLRQVGIVATFDNLVAAGRIPPVRVVMPDSLDTAVRWTELAARPEAIDALADHVLPHAAVPVGRRAVIAGNSLGGLTAVTATLRRPDRFAHAISMSGSVWWDPDESGVPLLIRAATLAPDPAAPSVGVELQVGLQEWVLTGPTRDLAAVLTGSGRRTELVEYQGGHDFAWWRGSLADGLIRWAERPDSGGASRLR